MGYALVAMSRYVLDHHLEGEKKRLALMSSLLDPLHQRRIESLRISRVPGAGSRLPAAAGKLGNIPFR
jgi:hypothetical protein